ncbi:hypothetical protein Tco_0400842, partial [Tanacetum coccineum]
MYRITKTETQTLDSKFNINVSNSTCVESSNSFRRPKSKDNKSKDRILKNTNDKRPSAQVRKMSSSVSIDSNKRETMHLNVCQPNTSVLNTKTVNVVNDSLNIVCVSCGKDVSLLSHEKCIARYALSRDYKVKRALFTLPIATKSKNLGATSVVVKSRLSVAKTPTTINKISSVLPHSIPKNEQSQKQSANVIVRGMYKITKTETQTLDYKSNINVSNSTGVESSNSVRRPKSKDNKSKDKVLKNTNDKRPSAHVRKMSSSVSIDSNRRETVHSN